MKLRSVGGVLLGALAGMLPSLAYAEDAVDLAWDAPAGCPQREAVQARVRELAGEALKNAERPRAEGRIVSVNGRYQLTLTVYEKGEARDRTMTSQSCDDLAGAAAIALGLLIRQRPSSSGEPGSSGTGAAAAPGAAAAETGAPGSEKSQSRTTPPAAPGTKPASKSPPGSTEPDDADRAGKSSEVEYSTYGSGLSLPGAWNADFILRAPAAVLDVGPLPKPGFGVGGAVGVRSSGWRITVGGRILMDQIWRIPGSADAGADVGRWQADLWLCRGFRIGRTELSPCLTAGLEGLSASGTGPGVTPSEQKSLSFVVGAAGTAHFYVFDSMAIFASVGVGIETTRPVLVVEELGPIGQVGPIQLSIALGPEWIF